MTWQRQYFIQSQFNLRIATRSKISPGDASYQEWCRHRAELFLDITLPSMLNQTCKSFEWLIYFDVDVNSSIERVLAALAPYENIHTISFDSRRSHPWTFLGHARMGVAERTAADTEVVLSTKLDTDDALHHDFVRIAHYQARQLSREEIGEGLAINCDYGAQLSDGRYLAYLNGANPFFTMVEFVRSADGGMLTFDELKTAITIKPYKVYETTPVKHLLYPQPLWLKTIHESNAFTEVVPDLLEFAEPEAVAALFGITSDRSR